MGLRIKVGDVAVVPVKTSPVYKSEKKSLKNLCECGGLQGNKKVCKSCGKEITKVTKKGYTLDSKGKEIVVFDAREIENLRLDTNILVDFENFVPSDVVDFRYNIKSNFLRPDEEEMGMLFGKMVNSEVAYKYLREMLGLLNLCGVTKMVMTTGREKLVGIRFWGNTLVLMDLCFPQELQQPAYIEPNGILDEEMVKKGMDILKGMKKEALFDIGKQVFIDSFTRQLKVLIANKFLGVEVPELKELKVKAEQKLEQEQKKEEEKLDELLNQAEQEKKVKKKIAVKV